MISENLSHDTYVMDPKYDNLPGVEYKDKTYDVYEWIDPKIKSKGKKKRRPENLSLCAIRMVRRVSFLKFS